MRILITGASGFVGGALTARCAADGFSVRVVTRRTNWPKTGQFPDGVEVQRVDSEATAVDWTNSLVGTHVVVHCAARVHIGNDRAPDPLREYRRVNTAGTLCLARQAALAGVRRFIFISTIGVNGAETLDRAFTPEDVPSPCSPYAVSKLEAEDGLREAAMGTGMEMVIIRPPLIYGPGAPGSFGPLARWVSRGIPLPLGAVHNRRSFAALGNVVDLLVRCISHPQAADQVLLISDGEDISTTQLLRRMGRALGKPVRLIPVPAGILRRAAALVGAADIGQKLLGSLQVDMSKTCRLLGWSPIVTVEEGLRQALRQPTAT